MTDENKCLYCGGRLNHRAQAASNGSAYSIVMETEHQLHADCIEKYVMKKRIAELENQTND